MPCLRLFSEAGSAWLLPFDGRGALIGDCQGTGQGFLRRFPDVHGSAWNLFSKIIQTLSSMAELWEGNGFGFPVLGNTHANCVSYEYINIYIYIPCSPFEHHGDVRRVLHGPSHGSPLGTDLEPAPCTQI